MIPLLEGVGWNILGVLGLHKSIIIIYQIWKLCLCKMGEDKKYSLIKVENNVACRNEFIVKCELRKNRY